MLASLLLPRRRLGAQRGPGDHRHAPGGPRGRVRPRGRGDAHHRPAGPGGRPPRGRGRAGPADPALARVDLHGALPLRARHPRQLLGPARRGHPDPGLGPPAAGLGHGRFHRRLPGVPPLGPRPGLCRVRRPLRRGRRHDARGAHGAAREGGRRQGARVAGPPPHGCPSSPGSTSSTRTPPTRRPRPTARATPAARTTARWPTPTPSWAGSSPGSTRRASEAGRWWW